jgi:hypothetical protein
VIADIDIRMPFPEIFTSIKIISDKREHAENPRPYPQKPSTDPADFSANQKGKDKARKKNDHENSKNQKYPEGIKLKQDPVN